MAVVFSKGNTKHIQVLWNIVRSNQAGPSLTGTLSKAGVASSVMEASKLFIQHEKLQIVDITAVLKRRIVELEFLDARNRVKADFKLGPGKGKPITFVKKKLEDMLLPLHPHLTVEAFRAKMSQLYFR